MDVEDAEGYLTRELDTITTQLANRYYLDDYVAEFPASDTAIKTVRVRKIADQPQLDTIEAISTRPIRMWWCTQFRDWQSAAVEYFVAGESGGESELLVNFRPEGTYRWVKKQLRVLIQ